MRRLVVLVSSTAALLAAGACSDGQPARIGLSEPVRVRGGQFIEGDLPGSAPGAKSPGPSITELASQSRIVLPGQAGKAFDGRAVTAAASVAVRMTDLGSGYWVFLPSGPDALFPGERSWHADLDFNAAFASASGFHKLRFVAIDASGNAGEQAETDVCFAPAVPDNLHACDPTIAPPEVVVSLAWDTDADLDLRVVTPEGRVVDAKHPTTSLDDAGAPAADAGLVDRDSLLACVPDGRRMENLVWQKRPTGAFDLYASLFDACGKQSVRYTLTVWEARGDMPARTLVATQAKHGIATAQDLARGAGAPEYLTSVTF